LFDHKKFPAGKQGKDKKHVGTQMNADFQDSIKQKMLFGDYLRKAASRSKKEFLLYPNPA